MRVASPELTETTKLLPGTVLDPMYPDEDGRPMGDTDFHSAALVWLRQALEDFFAAVLDVYVATNLIFYYEFGNPQARRDPDILVARGVGKHFRRSYRIWEEQVLPCTLFEIASRKTWRVDVGEKRQLYARLKIKEYFIFDPEARYVKPPLQGFQLRNGVSVAMKLGADGSLRSRQLGLRMIPEGRMLRLCDDKSGQPVLTRAERADQLAAEVAALEAEVRRLRKGTT
jgi:Uma2 family endonuclease